ncbi:hydrolase [Thioalkalivibrio thiocyanodenitrificans]|uniref:hydrolase n=1 Tax=Thioalkalivibrio thiocyanodenitrificans TaxID=243063 RepID=UPI00037C8EA4|nr:hydrolase [Thioalkalivibrio thiocyanodenitrificans]
MARSRLCHAARSQLLIVDMQERLAGAMDSAERESALRAAGILAQAAGQMDVPVVVSEQYPRGLGPTVDALHRQFPDTTRILEKIAFSCCGDSGILDALNAARRPQVVVCGMETHVCVLQTAMDLLEAGFQPFVVEDAACSRNPANKVNALHRLRQAGAVVTNCESVLFEWLRDARHARFKALTALIK